MKKLTERDLNILIDLYKYRTLSVEQISKVHFPGGIGYAYRRLYLLKKEGYVSSYQVVSFKNSKQGACYNITERGIDTLVENKVIYQKRRARDNKVHGPALPHIIEINDLYVHLNSFGWVFHPSRDVKKNYGMNRSALVKGALVNENGREFITYLFEENSREDTIEQSVREIKSHNFEHVLLLCKGKESYFNIMEKVERVTIAGSINLLPYPFALKVLKWLNKDQAIQNVFQRYGPINPIQTKNEFTLFTIQHEGEEKYITNYLLGDQISKYFLKKYAYDRYQVDGKKVLLFAWKGQLPELLEEFKSYPHIEIVMVQMQEKQSEGVL